MVFRVALTGGIASGKSAVAMEFAALGVPVIDTDLIARDLRAPGTPTLERIVAEFGSDMLDDTGQLDRRRMRERIFGDPEQRKKLESILHPAIRGEVARRSAEAGGPYQIHVIPLFVERGAKGDYDRVLVVDSPEEMQLQRVMRRDSIDELQAGRVLAAQAGRRERLAVAHDVIINDSTLDRLQEKVRTLHERYLELVRTRAPTGA